MSSSSPSGPPNNGSNFWDTFNPTTSEFKKAEEIFHNDLRWEKQALVVVASIVGAVFFIVGAFPIFRWTVTALKPGVDESSEKVDALKNAITSLSSAKVDEKIVNGNKGLTLEGARQAEGALVTQNPTVPPKNINRVFQEEGNATKQPVAPAILRNVEASLDRTDPKDEIIDRIVNASIQKSHIHSFRTLSSILYLAIEKAFISTKGRDTWASGLSSRVQESFKEADGNPIRRSKILKNLLSSFKEVFEEEDLLSLNHEINSLRAGFLKGLGERGE